MGTNTPLAWSVVIPVKLLARAKSRLADLADADREAVALAMAADTVAAAMACQVVADVVGVSDDAGNAVQPEVRLVVADAPSPGRGGRARPAWHSRAEARRRHARRPAHRRADRARQQNSVGARIDQVGDQLRRAPVPAGTQTGWRP